MLSRSYDRDWPFFSRKRRRAALHYIKKRVKGKSPNNTTNTHARTHTPPVSRIDRDWPCAVISPHNDSSYLPCSSKDSSLQGLQETAMSIFTKKPEPPSEKAGDKKLANMPPLAAPTVSPLARFLLTRLVHSYIFFSLLSNTHDK